jgi:hypothetical protein
VVPTPRRVLEGLEAEPTDQELPKNLPGLNRLPLEQSLPVVEPRAEVLSERQRVHTGRKSRQAVQVLKLRLKVRPLALASLDRWKESRARRPEKAPFGSYPRPARSVYRINDPAAGGWQVR